MEQTQPTTGACARCIFKMAGKSACVAFPRGIPAEILAGQFDHSQPYEGDGGIRFVALRRPRSTDPRPDSSPPR